MRAALPARTSDMAAGMVTISNGTCPPSVSATAGPRLVRHMDDVDPGPQHQQLAGDVRRRAIADRGEMQAARIGLGLATRSAMLSICAPG